MVPAISMPLLLASLKFAITLPLVGQAQPVSSLKSAGLVSGLMVVFVFSVGWVFVIGFTLVDVVVSSLAISVFS